MLAALIAVTTSVISCVALMVTSDPFIFNVDDVPEAVSTALFAAPVVLAVTSALTSESSAAHLCTAKATVDPVNTPAPLAFAVNCKSPDPLTAAVNAKSVLALILAASAVTKVSVVAVVPLTEGIS